MSETPVPRLAETYAEVEDALLSRWPETRLEPSLDRIGAFTELLGDPQRVLRVIHLTGTNGKTSTSRMIDTLLRALDLRTGRFTSPHLERMTERISIDGEPLDDEAFVRAFNDVAPYTHLVDGDQPHPLSFFETVVGMAYAAFADAPVDVAVVEVGMGGAWDATNVVDAEVAVVLPDRGRPRAVPRRHARRPSPRRRPASSSPAPSSSPPSRRPRSRRCSSRRAPRSAPPWPARARLRRRVPGPGRRRPGALAAGPARRRTTRSSCRCTAPTRPRTPSLALAAVEAFAGEARPRRRHGPGGVRRGHLARPARGDPAQPRRSCSTPLTTRTVPRPRPPRSRTPSPSTPLIGVIGVMADKDYEGLLAAFEPHLAHIVCTQNSTPRSMPAAELGRGRARGLRRGPGHRGAALDRRHRPGRRAGRGREAFGDALGTGAVLVTGSVVTVGEARALLRRPG